MATFEELLAELQGLISPAPARSMPPPQPVESAEELRTPVNRLLAAGPEPMPPVQPTGELRAYEPTAGENARLAVNRLLGPAMGERVGGAVNRLLDYGPVPAQMATDVAMQPVRAGEAVGTALHDPTLANVTNAGVQTGMAVMRPAMALGALGLGYGEAARRDLGIGTGEAVAEEGQPTEDPLAGLYAQRASLDQQRQVAQSRMEAERRTGQGPRFQAAQQEFQRLTSELAGLDQMIARREQMNSPEAQERQRAVQRAEAARDFELSRERRFSDTETGKLYEATGGLAPAVAGALTGGISRLATGGGGALHNYVLPGGLGTAAGVASANLPLAYNALATEPDNPARNALLAYARELPEDHPERARALREARAMPEENPVRAAASDEFYDPTRLIERSVMGGIEGALGGLLGADVVRIGGRPVNALMRAASSRRGGQTPAAPTPQPQREVIIERVDKRGRPYRFNRETGRRVPLND